MKNIFKKENLMPVIVLGAICLVVAALMGAVNMVTGPIIQKAEEQKVYDSLREVLDGEFEPAELPEGAPSTVTALYKVTEGGELIGHVVTLEKQGYASKILLTVGIDKDGKTTKVVITGQQETHGKDISPLLDGLASVGADEVMDVDHVANATKTSEYIKEAVADAFKAIGFETPDVDGGEEGGNEGGNEGGEEGGEETPEALPKTDEEILSLAGQLVGEGSAFTDVTPDGNEFVKRVYKENGGNGYVAYILVMSRYGTPETETLIHVGKDGKIAGINKLTWKTSDPMYGYVPPTDEVVDPFYDRLIGFDAQGLKDLLTKVENEEDILVTNATNTSTALVNSLIEALEAIDGIRASELPRSEDEIKSLAVSLIGSDAELTDVTPAETEFVKRIYRASGNKGYIGYVVVMSRYGTIETETLIHVGSNGKIAGLNKLTWKTSDPMYGYVPPTDEVVDPFYDRLVGFDTNGLKDLLTKVENEEDILVTNATNTSTSLVNSIIEALEDIDALRAKDLPRDEAEIITLAGQLVGVDPDFSDVTPADLTNVKRIYIDNGGNGYVAYLVVMSQYGTVETETLVHIDNSGKIVGVDKLIWKTSDAIYGYVPPTEEQVNPFYDRLVGTDSETLGDVELVTNATNTSTSLVNAISEALEAVKDLPKIDKPRTDEEIKSLAAELVGGNVDLTEVTVEDATFVKRIYSAGDKGYVVYVVVISENYGTVETETLIYVNTEGKIEGLNKLTWKTSDAIYGYVPPTDEVVDPFYDRLVGFDAQGLKDLLIKVENEEDILVTNATNTSTNLVNSIIEALDIVDGLIVPDVQTDNSARIIGIVVICVALVGSVAAVIIKRRKRV
ncbi:MAG: FMN-binding protein [Clostridia bacterium]|nr:FMN-binding protein [Clostridia bacterium]